MNERGSPVHISKPSRDYSTKIGVGRSDFTLSLTNGMRDNNSSIYLSISGPSAKAHFCILRDRFKEAIETKLGPVEWRDKESQIRVVRASTPTDRSTWPELNEWMRTTVERWVETLKPIILTLDTSQYLSPPDGVPGGDSTGLQAGEASP